MNKKITILLSFLCLWWFSAENISAVTFVKPGDTGSMILPVKNVSESISDMEGAEIKVTAPSYFIVKGTSLLGPQAISPNNSYIFKVFYEISSTATDGSFDVNLKVKTTTSNCIPKSPDTSWDTLHQFTIDTLPQATDQSTGNPIVKDKKYKQDVVITLPAPDETYTDIYGKLDGGGEFRNPDTKTAGEGNHVLIIYYKDKNGNITTRTINFMVDKTAPTVEIAGVEDGGLYNADKTVTVTASDNLDPKPKIEGTISGESSASKTFGEGKHTVTEKAVDWAGNTSETKMVTFTIDKTPPTISLYPSNGSVYYAMKYKFHYYYCQTEKYDEYIEPARI